MYCLLPSSTVSRIPLNVILDAAQFIWMYYLNFLTFGGGSGVICPLCLYENHIFSPLMTKVLIVFVGQDEILYLKSHSSILDMHLYTA